jgi:hypothetical protein
VSGVAASTSRPSRRRLIAIAAAAAILALISLPASRASATVVGHSFDSSFGGSGANALLSASGIAVDDSNGSSAGDVYVGDVAGARIEKFDAAGNFLLMFGKGVNQTGGGDICPRPGVPSDVCQAGAAGSGAAQFTDPKYIAVDWTAGPSAGDIYVLDPSTDLIQKFAPSGALITSWGGPPAGPSGGQIDGSGIPNFGAWSNPQGIAVDANGDLNVLNASSGSGGLRIFVFSQDGTYRRTLVLGFYGASNESGLAVDTLGNFLTGSRRGFGGEYKYSPTGEALTNDFTYQGIVGGTVTGRTVDVSPDPRRTDDYYLATATTINQYHWRQPREWLQPDGSYCFAGDGGCGPTSTFGSANLGESTGVAISSDSTAYVPDQSPKMVLVFKPIVTPDVENLTASDLTDHTATLSGDVGLAGGGDVTDCYFEYGRSNAYEMPAVPCSPSASAGAPFTADQHVQADLSGLVPNAVYHFRLAATDANGTQKSEDSTFTTAGPPGIESFNTSGLTASSTDFNAKINPHGAETTYVFNYGKTTLYGSSAPVPPGEIAAGFSPEDVVTHVQLEDAGYHFQVVATNKYGSVTSEDQAFSFHPQECPNQTVRQQTGAAYLPDCRAYELVSPADSGSAFIFDGGPQRPYAENPPRFAFTADFGDMPEAGGHPINTTGDLYVATRGSGGWTTKFVGVPASVSGCAGGRPVFAGAGLASTVQNDVKATRDLGRVVDWQLGNPTQCVWDTIGVDLRVVDKNEKAHASMAPWMWSTDDGSLVTRLPTSVAHVPGWEEDFDCPQVPSEAADTHCSNAVELSGDLTHFVFSTQSDIYNGGLDALSAAPGSAYDNDTVHNTLSLISVLPGTGGPILQESAPNGGPDEVIQFPTVSEDGSHILMGTLKNPQCRQTEYPDSVRSICPQISNPTHLYMRVNDAVTYEIAPVPVTYVGATPDARRVYFTTAQALTSEDTDSNVDLYMWSDIGGAPELTLISQGSAGGNGEDCGATWISGCDIETYKDTQISSAAANRGGLSPTWWTAGANGITPAPGNTGTKGFTDNAIATASGDIVFYSPEDLDGTGVLRGVNVYEYRNGATQLVATLENEPYCIKEEQFQTIQDNRPGRCSDGPLGRLQVTPDGRYLAFITTTRLTSYNNAGHAEMYRYDADTRHLLCISCRPDGQPPTSDTLASYDGRYITDDGRVFFTTNEEISPRDTNTSVDLFTGKTLGADVYEYSGGVPQLITTGTGQQAGGLGLTAEAWPGLLGVSANGSDVYFLWPEPLVGQDLNGSNNYRVYDARIDGGFSYNPPPPPCRAADECHGTASQPAPDLASATSARLAGGNMNEASCTPKLRKTARTARRLTRHAGRLRQRARKSPSARRSRALRHRSRRLAKHAKRLSQKSRSCRRGGKGGAR